MRSTRVSAALLGLMAIANVAAASEIPSELVQFRAERGRIAADLSEPVAACVARHDTARPVFHGCVDWHSSVHGVWALTAYTWATGDARYKTMLRSMLDPRLVAEERDFLAGNRDFEMPYGRSWFLRLTVDYRRLFQDGLLDSFGSAVAASLIDRYRAKPPDPTAGAYDSDTWALINLYDYAEAANDQKLRDFVTAQVRQHYLIGGPCPAARAEVASGEFMAICTNWAWLVSKILPRDEFIPWLGRFLPQGQPIAPIADPDGAHQSGLNFSRAWGLWALYLKTDDRYWLSPYLAHVHATYDHPDQWKGGYWTVGHWVPQFGMLAVIMTYYDWP
jgi:DUF2891 family protein